MKSQFPVPSRQQSTHQQIPTQSVIGLGKEPIRRDAPAILRCRDHLRTQEAAAAFSYKVASLVPGTCQLVLDFTGIEPSNVVRLGELVVVLMWAKARGCSIQLIGVTREIEKALDESNLGSLFSAYQTLEQAIIAEQCIRAA